MNERFVLMSALAMAAACARGPVQPAALDTKNDMCAFCRMLVSDPKTAAQLVVPGEEPKLFDDVGCLASYLKGAPPLPAGSGVWVADHRTAEWTPARDAIYTRGAEIETPMSSHLIAHSDPRSRAADPLAARGPTVASTLVFGGPPP